MPKKTPYEPPETTDSMRAGETPLLDFVPLGNVRSYQIDGATATFRCANGQLQLTALAENCYRVWATREAAFPELFSYAVAREDHAWPRPPLTAREERDRVVVRAGEHVCYVARTDAGLAFAAADGRVICADEFASMTWQDKALWLHKRLAPDEAIYGLGERAFPLNLRGRRYTLWNQDPAVYEPGEDPINLCIPFYVAVRDDGHAYGLFFDSPYRGTVDVGAEQIERLTFHLEGGELRYYLFTGPSVAEVLARFTELTGRMPMPPLWALGYHQCRWSYYPEAKVREIAAGFRQRRIPCDAIYLDIDYMDGFRCFTWDRERFPDFPGLIRDLRADGFHTVVIIDPGIKEDPNYAVYRSGILQDVFLKGPDGKPYTGIVWPGDCHFPDFSSPRVRAWWGDLYSGLVDAGVAGFWNDMNEPALFPGSGDFSHGANTLPDDVLHDWDGRGETHLAAHNVYGMLMVRATREGLERLRPGVRPFVMTRAGHAGVQRYASSWTADNQSTWEQLRLSISMCLNLGLSGLSFTGPDIGGFAGEPTAELVTRWVQLGACLPFFRMHTATGTPDQEPWSYGQPYEDINRRYIELRYRLLPYIYTAFAECARSGAPIVQPMVMHGSAVRFKDIDDQFMLGPNLLVAPVVEPGVEARAVLLPKGLWYNFWTGKRLDGGSGGVAVTVPAPLDVLPLFVRAGAVLPLWPVMQYTGERLVDTLTLRVYMGQGRSILYEDKGDGPTAPDGWSTFDVWLNMDENTFVVNWERASRTPPPYKQVNVELYGVPWEIDAVLIDGEPAPIWTVDGDTVQVMGVPIFKELRLQPPEA